MAERDPVKNSEDVVLYNGSLEELNKRELSPGYEYVFPKETIVCTSFSPMNSAGCFREDILEKGYDGVVNGRRVTYDGSRSLEGELLHLNPQFAFEGTPIIRVKKQES